MKEDTGLKNKIGKNNPFKVPEGYFENLVPDIMKQLHDTEIYEEQKITLWERVKPWVYMVAMFCGIMFSLRVMMRDRAVHTDNNIENMSSTDSVEGIPEEYIDPILSQTMMDDYTLYVYLTDADNEIYN